MIEGAVVIGLLLLSITLHAWHRGQLHLASPIVLTVFWCSILFVGRPLYIGLSGHWELVDHFSSGRPDNFLLAQAFAYVAIGIIAYYLGFNLPSPKLLARLRAPNLPVRSWQIALVTVVFLIWGAYSFARFKPLPVETGMFDENFQIEGGKFTDTSAYVASAWMCITTIIYILAASLRQRWPSILLLAAFGLAIFYGGWSRSSALVTAIGLVMIEELMGQKKVILLSVLIAFPLLLPTFNQLSVDREYVQKAWRGESSSGNVEEFLPREFSDFDGYVGIVSQVPEKLDYSYGMEFVNRFFVIAVPRVFWKEKSALLMPEDKYELRNHFLAGGRVNTILGPLYMEGGVVAITFMLLIIGYLARLSYAAALAAEQHPYIVGAYVLFHLHFLCSWRDFFQPQWLFLAGQPLMFLILLSVLSRQSSPTSRELASGSQ